MTVSADSCPVDLADGLSRAGDDCEFYRELLELFLDDARGRLATLKRALAAPNLAEVTMAAHSIKGAAANLSAGRARDLAFAIEQGARNGNATGLDDIVGQLAAEVERIARFAGSFSWP